MRKAAFTLIAFNGLNYAAAQCTKDASYLYETGTGTLTTITLISGNRSTKIDGSPVLRESPPAWLFDGATINTKN